jgi:hypothetical protein
VRDCDLRALRHPDPNAARLKDVAVAPHGNRGGPFAATLIVDFVSDGLRLTDNAEARRGDEFNPVMRA